MIRRFLCALVLGYSLLTSNGGLAQSDSQPPTLAPMIGKVVPAVVSIGVRGKVATRENPLLSDPFFRRFFGLPDEAQPKEREFRAAGSGVVVDPQRGYILTNNHVVENADEITVALADRRRLPATRIGTDPATDLAVIQIDADSLSGLPLGDSDTLKVGDYVVAVGNPFGLGQTVTLGIVSALGRTGLGIEGYEDFIQTDASINPGNSGGALVNLKGELVGINSAIIGPSGGNVGIGFAIPINMARSVMEQLVAHGEIKRGQLGVTVQDLTPELARGLKLRLEKGALVSQVLPGSPAEKADIEAGDVITEVNGQQVSGASDLRNKIGMMSLGTEVRLSIVRKGKAIEVRAVLADQTPVSTTVPEDVGALASVTLGTIEPGSGLYGRVEGAVVLKLDPNSRAAQAGLQAGDVIVSVDQQPVRSPDDVVAVARQTGGDEMLLQILRNGEMHFLVIS